MWITVVCYNVYLVVLQILNLIHMCIVFFSPISPQARGAWSQLSGGGDGFVDGRFCPRRSWFPQSQWRHAEGNELCQ